MDDEAEWAKVTDESVWACLRASLVAKANNDMKEAEKWMAQADKLESKFKTRFGKHYADALPDDSRYKERALIRTMQDKAFINALNKMAGL